MDPSSASTNNISTGDSPAPSTFAVSSSILLNNRLPHGSNEHTAVGSNQVKEREGAVDETLVVIGAPNNHRSNVQGTATVEPSVDGVDATSPSGLGAQEPSVDQPSRSAPVSLVDQFLEIFTAKLSGTDHSGFEEIFIPILKRRLPTTNESLQKSIISYFESGGSFSQPILKHCALSDWVKESLIQDLSCGHYEDGNEITYPHFLKQLDKIVGHYQGPSLKQLLLAICDTVKKESFGLMELSDLLTFLLPRRDYDAVSTLLSSRSNWIACLQSKYLTHQLAKQKVSLSPKDQLFLSNAIARSRWRPCMITELGIGRLNKCLGQLATRVVEDQIEDLFPDYASSINGQLPSFFTYASPIETLEIFRSFLNSLPQVDRSSPSASTFNSFLQEIDIHTLWNESISKHFLDAITLLSEYKVDGPTAISAFKLLKEKKKKNPTHGKVLFMS
ncbi:hypothetical protein AVEN_152813-1 [Araneus ventricosus]|uniref:Uncharacterized protein n=1 Tax=Araneus ventricosus TaxID=182803 RepID=A0A4Y2LHP6_ARAVE|nr:hypothetical protein AVEN_152813-1 [Araneus ventricosus]